MLFGSNQLFYYACLFKHITEKRETIMVMIIFMSNQCSEYLVCRVKHCEWME